MAHPHTQTRLIGRDRELAALNAFVGQAAAGGATLLLTGEPGVGKTALLVAATGIAPADGARIVQGAVSSTRPT
jgi:DNA replication protein DnaC